MKNKLSKHTNQKVLLYILTLFLFAGCIVTTYGIKTSVFGYYEESISLYKESRWDSFLTNFRSAYALGKFGLVNSSNKVQKEIKSNLDMDKLKNSLTNNTFYSDLDKVLRSSLQKNAFNIRNIDKNRNSIFVLCNGNVVADYAHDNKYGIPYKEEQKINGNNLESIMQSDFFNKELSLNALKQIENQSEDLIVWQSRKPLNPNAKKYNTFNIDTMREIFEAEGIDGFTSYEILIPTYITDYGNIFGDYDITSDKKINNKIILIQKLNIRDYYSEFMPASDIMSEDSLMKIQKEYLDLKIVINIFEVILYLCISSYIFFVIFGINQIIENDIDEEES